MDRRVAVEVGTNACVCVFFMPVLACTAMRGREHLVSYLFMEATGRL